MRLETADPSGGDALQRAALRNLLSNRATLDKLLQRLAEAVSADFTFIRVCNGDQLHAVAVHGLALPSASTDLTYFKLIKEDGLLIEDASADWRFRFHPLVLSVPGFRAGMSHLIKAMGFDVGSISAASAKPHAFSADQLPVLKSFSHEVEKMIGKEGLL